MKKMIIGLAAGALALGATAMPASAGAPTDSIWDIIDDSLNPFSGFSSTEILEDIILISGYATMLDACGNGEAQYTLFAPLDGVFVPAAAGAGTILGVFSFLTEPEIDALLDDSVYALPVLEAVLDVLGFTVADLNSASAVVRGILNDHLVNGSFSPEQLDLDEITTITARSGFTLRNENGSLINDQPIAGFLDACNGYVYYILGFLDSTAQVPTEGLNALDTPQDGTPGGSNTLLPDTL